MNAPLRHVKPDQEGRFYHEGRDWESNQRTDYIKSERRAWRIAIVSVCVTIVAVSGLAMLAPLRKVVPYVIEVDKTNGNMQMVEASNDRSRMGYQDLLDKHWAQRFVTARESYVYKLLQADYDTTLSLSSAQVGQDYARLFQGDNARDKLLGTSTEIKVHILSISLAPDPNGSKAVVRFEKQTRHLENGLSEPIQTYVATLSYEYQPSQTGPEKELIANPLGYHVTSYRVDEELAPLAGAKPNQAPQSAIPVSTSVAGG